MGLRLRPHSVAVFAPVETVDGATSRVSALTFGVSATATVTCKMEPLSPSTAFDLFGVDSRQPHRLMCDDADGASLARVGTRVVWNAVNYRVVAWRRFQSGLIPHWSYLLEQEAGP